MRAGVDCLARNVERINQLNVFPVPDGDTGVNMHNTLQRACEEIAGLRSDDASLIAERFAFGALMGARGNSGTILSQLLKGFADGLGDSPVLTPPLFAEACAAAVARGYAAVSQPTEGTILTVAREAAESLRRYDGAAGSLKEMLDVMTLAARASLENTPNLLPILKDANVVDAGGMGLLCFLEGMRTGDPQLEIAAPRMTGSAPAIDDLGDDFGYDVQFLMIGAGLDVGQTRRDLEAMGWSVIVVGDDRLIKAHIHVENPALPLDYAIRSGAALDDVVVENMTRQFQRSRGSPLPAPKAVESDPAASVIAVVAGDGLRAIFRDLNCGAIIDGGGGSNPSTEDFIRAMARSPAETLILLPNNRNVIMAARQAADMAEGPRAEVVATETVQQGINAMLAFGDARDSAADFETMVAQMREAAAETVSIEIARASRATRIHDLDVNENDCIGIVDGIIRVASTDITSATVKALATLEARGLELATIYYGAGFSASDADQLIQRLRKAFEGLEFEAVYGGQPLYPLLISVE